MWKLKVQHSVFKFIDNMVFDDATDAKRWYDHYISSRFGPVRVRLWDPNGELVHHFDNRKRKR